MGMGYGFTCKSCKNWYSVCPGTGMQFPYVYESCIKDIKAGKYGEEWKTLFQSHPYLAVDAGYYLYICESCGNWKTAISLSLYEPDEITIESGIELDWIEPKYLKSLGYSLLKAYVHRCGKCGKEMHKVDVEQLSSLPCPKCGTENESIERLCWD